MPQITDTMVYESLTRSVAKAEVRMQQAQVAAASGLRVTAPNQDPTAALQGTLLASSMAQLKSMDAVSNRATSNLGATDRTLMTIQNILVGAREVVVQANTATVGAPERQGLGDVIGALKENLVSLFNTQIGEDYLFGGFSDKAPFAEDGTYQGDSGVQYGEVGPNETLAFNLPGDKLFASVTDSSTTPPTTRGVNIIAGLQALQTALQTNDLDGIRAGFQILDDSVGQVSSGQAQVGALMKQLENADDARAQTLLYLSRDRSNLMEANTAQSLSELVQATTTYQATITEAARILQSLSGGLLNNHG